jgi:hypothetical protein
LEGWEQKQLAFLFSFLGSDSQPRSLPENSLKTQQRLGCAGTYRLRAHTAYGEKNFKNIFQNRAFLMKTLVEFCLSVERTDETKP